MRKKTLDEPVTKAKRREIRKRPRQKMHGASLRRPSPYAGGKLFKK